MTTSPRIAVLQRCHLLTVLMLLLLGASRAAANDFDEQRNRMVDDEIVAAGIKDPRVIQSMRDTQRHEFMPIALRANAYYDMALAIGNGQTISPPFVVAYMTEQLLPKSTDKVLEIGTGSGYQAAVLSPLVKEVYTIEIVKPLGERAARAFKRLKYNNIFAKVGDGYQGWPEHAPFDKIIVTCSPEQVPPKLVEQLREGGRMIVPVGERYQQTLYLFEKKDGKLNKIALLPTLFVPMTGKAEEGRVVKPDPLKPAVINGGFEHLAADPTVEKSEKGDELPTLAPAGWHYQRQLKVEDSSQSPEGSHFITFSNKEAGRGAHALQGLAIDGRKVHAVNVSLWVRSTNVRQGESEFQLPSLHLIFYDENRKEVGDKFVGPWRDSSPWQHIKDRIQVPAKAREAVLRVGMHGATGEFSVDGVRIEAAN